MTRFTAAAAGLILVLITARAAVGQGIEVESLRFEGAKAFNRTELAAAIETSATRCPNLLYALVCWAGVGEEEAFLPSGALDSDPLRLKVYYYERGYRNAQVSVDTAHVGEDQVRITFHIREGEPVRVATLAVSGMPPSLKQGSLPLRAGEALDMVTYEATRDTLLNRLHDHGFARAEVLPGYMIPSAAPEQANVEYQVVPGTRARFGQIHVVGNDETTPELVRRMLSLKEGDRYDRSALLRSQRNLYALQIFRHAEVRADLSAGSDSVIPVTVQVTEGDLHRVRVGAGFNNVECGNLEASWSSRNFMGDGRRLEVRGRLGNLLMGELCRQVPWLTGDYVAYDSLTGLVSVDFTQPWLLGPRNSIGGGLFAERRSVPGVFVRSAVGGYISLGHSVGRKGMLALSYRPELTLLQAEGGGDLFFCVNFLACAYDELAMLRDPHWLSPLALSFSMDRTDAQFTPSSGFIVRADAEYADRFTGSDFAYTRLSGEASTYVGKAGGVILATRLHGGVAWPHASSNAGVRVNPLKRFFAGGANSVRGFDQYRLGPTVLGISAVPYLVNGEQTEYQGPGCTPASVNDGTCVLQHLPNGVIDVRPAGGEVLLEGSMELRFPLPVLRGKLRGAVFLDAGQVWATAADVDLATIVATPGVGLRYYSPIGPIRIDAGYNTRGPVSLPVLTTRVESCMLDQPGCQKVNGDQQIWTLRNTDDVVLLDHMVTYGTYTGDPVAAFFRRVRLHFSIGQAF